MRALPAFLIACLFVLMFALPQAQEKERSVALRTSSAAVVFNAASGLLELDHGGGHATVALGRTEGEEIVPLQVSVQGEETTWVDEHQVSLPIGDPIVGRLHMMLRNDAVSLWLEPIPNASLAAPSSLAVTLARSQQETESDQPAQIHLVRAQAPVVIAATTRFQFEPSEEHVRAVVDGVVHLAVHAEEGQAYGPAFRALGVPAFPVLGKVTTQSPSSFRAHVRGYNASGTPAVDIMANSDGSFKTFASSEVVQWTATYGASAESAEARYTPGETEGPLELHAAPGGTLTIRVADADGGKPLVARIIVRGAFGTIDPNFGPEFRASGAGQVADVLRGEFTTQLPLGKYHVLATKGLEWSIDSADVELKSGEHKTVLLEPRHVVPTPETVGCDLHVHARPSFDTLVSAEDRVLSLVAAGVDFAVPTEHNVVGDYGGALQFLGLARELAYVPGVEVTPFAPRFGHFGVFPWPVRGEVPPFRKTTPSAIFNTVRRDQDPDRILQVNHPWLLKQIGYFDVLHVDTKSGRHEMKARMDFDAIEILNGFEMEHVDAVERSIAAYIDLINLGKRYVATGSSDSHNLLYGWAGYPRTYARVGKLDPAAALNPLSVVRAIKRGHVTISAGPVLTFRIGTAFPGDTTAARDAHIEVHAAPWVDVRSVDLIVDGRVVLHRDLPKRETKEGKEPGSRAEAEARTLRFTEAPTIPADAHWAMLIARGEETLDRYLPATHIRPVAFTNPIWLSPKAAAPP